MDKRKLAFALVAIVCAAIFLLVSGLKEIAWVGFALTVGGAIDFLFQNWSLEGKISSEVYGEAGEEAWEFRSFFLMALGPFVSLYPLLFG